MLISIWDFARTGLFGAISTVMSQTDVHKYLGEPGLWTKESM